jgi:hypothetical protein
MLLTWKEERESARDEEEEEEIKRGCTYENLNRVWVNLRSVSVVSGMAVVLL